MFIKVFTFALLVLFAPGAFLKAACTEEDAAGKANVFAAFLAQVAQKDSHKYIEIVTAVNSDLPRLQADKQNLEPLCRFYDSWLEKMK